MTFVSLPLEVYIVPEKCFKDHGPNPILPWSDTLALAGVRHVASPIVVVDQATPQPHSSL